MNERATQEVDLKIDLRHSEPRQTLHPGPVVGPDNGSTTTLSADMRSLLNRHLFGTWLSRVVSRRSITDRSPSRTYRFAKRAADVTVSLLLLVLLIPVLFITALAVRFTSRGPIFYRHSRLGVGSTVFKMVKFRSMVDGADGRLAAMDELVRRGEVEALDEVVFKAPDDPRVTRVGRFLRRTNIDEIPQLLNVVAGQMSLVGPRPLVAKEIETLGDWSKDQRLSARPGVTGLWQVARGEETTFAERMALDLLYVEQRSALLDICLFAMTPIAIVRGARSH